MHEEILKAWRKARKADAKAKAKVKKPVAPIPPEKLTKAELTVELEKAGITFNRRASKKELLALLQG